MNAEARPNVRLSNMQLFGRTLPKIWSHLWLCICGVLHSPLMLSWSLCSCY